MEDKIKNPNDEAEVLTQSSESAQTNKPAASNIANQYVQKLKQLVTMLQNMLKKDAAITTTAEAAVERNQRLEDQIATEEKQNRLLEAQIESLKEQIKLLKELYEGAKRKQR